MKDLLHDLLKGIDYERGKIFGALIGIVIVIAVVGCEVSIQSPITGEKVTRDDFKLEVLASESDLEQQRLDIEKLQVNYNKQAALHNEQVESAEAKFVEAEKFRDGFLELTSGAIITAMTGGSVDMAQLGVSILMLAGLGGTAGGIYDSARKNKVIENQKAAIASS